MAKRQSSDMTAVEYQAIVDSFGGHAPVAAAIGASRVQSYRMASGECEVPLTEATLLRLMVKLRITPDRLQRIANPLGSA